MEGYLLLLAGWWAIRCSARCRRDGLTVGCVRPRLGFNVVKANREMWRWRRRERWRWLVMMGGPFEFVISTKIQALAFRYEPVKCPAMRRTDVDGSNLVPHIACLFWPDTRFTHDTTSALEIQNLTPVISLNRSIVQECYRSSSTQSTKHKHRDQQTHKTQNTAKKRQQ